MRREDSSIYAACLDETLKVIRTIEFMKTALVYKMNNENNNFNNVFGWNDSNYTVKDIPYLIRSMKYNSGDGSFNVGVPSTLISGGVVNWDKSYKAEKSNYGKYTDLELTVDASFNFEPLYYSNNQFMYGHDTWSVRDLSGTYNIEGVTKMRVGYDQDPNLMIEYINGNGYQQVTPITDVQDVSLEGLFRGFRVKLWAKPEESLYASVGCYVQSLTIPKFFEELGDYCFYNAYNLERVSIQASLETLPDYCFAYCKKLRSINIPKTITSIGKECFAHDSSLIFNNGHLDLNCDKLTTIGDRAFEYTSISKLTIGPKVETIGIDAFAMCENLIEIDAKCINPPSLLTDGTGNAAAFYLVHMDGVLNIPPEANVAEWIQWCSGDSGPYSHLLERRWEIRQRGVLVWKGTVDNKCIPYTTSDNAPLWSDPALYPPGLAEDVHFSGSPSGVLRYNNKLTAIPDLTFRGKNITSIALPNTVKTIGTQIFYECEHIYTFSIPTSVTTISANAFENCSLKSITFNYPSHVSVIGNGAFSYTNITEMTVPASVTTIKGSPWIGIHKIKYIRFMGTTPPRLTDYADDNPATSGFYDTGYMKNGEWFEPPIYVPNPDTYYSNGGREWRYWCDAGRVLQG